MATYISNGSGDWTTIPWLTAATGTFTPTAPAAGSPPSNGRDKIVIRGGNVVTYNTSGVFGDGGVGHTLGVNTKNPTTAAIILSGGTLRASRTQNTALTAVGVIYIDGGTAAGSNSFFDWGTLNDPVSAVTSTISLSGFKDGTSGIAAARVTASTITIPHSACFCGLEKTRNTFLTSSANAGQPVINVSSCTNWLTGDLIILESDTTNTQRLTAGRVTDITGNAVTLDQNLNFTRLSGTRVGNFTSTVTVKSLETAPRAFGIYLDGSTNAIYQLSNITIENTHTKWARSDATTSVAEGTSIYYNANYNTTSPVFRKIALNNNFTGNTNEVLYLFQSPIEEVVFDNLATYSSYGTVNNIFVLNLGSNAWARFTNSVVYRSQNTYQLATPYRITFENCYLNGEFCVATTADAKGPYFTMNNCTLRSNGQLLYYDNFISSRFNNCTFTYPSNRFLISNTTNSFGDYTFNDCTTNVPVSSFNSSNPTIRTLSEGSINIFNPNNDNSFSSFNYFYYATTSYSIRKNGITSLSFRPKVANERFTKTFTIQGIQGVTQKIKGNLRFDSAYGNTNPPSISFGGSVASTTFTSPTVPDIWNSFEYDLTPTFTGDIEIKLTGMSSLTSGFVYLDGLNLDPFIKDTRWYGFQVDKNPYRTIDTSTTLTENQVSAYPYVNNLDFLYDECRYWTATNPTSSSYVDLVQNAGRTLNFSNRGLALNSSALSSISFNPTTNIVTLSTFNLSAGNNFSTIQTTGGVTINDNSAISNVSFIGSVSATTARNLNGVVIDGTLTYNTNATVVITYTNCNIKKVENNGSGIITLNRLNTVVTEAGRNVVVLENPTYINPSLNGGYLAIFDNLGTLRYYTDKDDQIILPNGSTGVWSYKVGRYNYKVITGTFSTGTTVNIIPPYGINLDQLVLENNVTVASAYNSFRNTQQIYDYLSYYMTTSEGLSYPSFYNYRNVLDITGEDLILNPSASDPFSFDGSAITVRSTNLENGFNVKGIETTGNIFLSGAASLSAINIIANKINSASVVSLNSINAANSTSIVYNTNSPFVITYVNCNIPKVENLGSGDIRIKKINSTITDGTDAQISDYYPTYLNLSLALGTIAIYDNASVRQYFTSNNQTIELPYEADGAWTYTATRYGQRTVLGGFTVNREVGGNFDITPLFQPDVYVFSPLNVVSNYTTFTTIQSIYDYMSYYKTTSTGIDFGDLVNTGSILDIGGRSLILNSTASSPFSATTNSVILSTDSLSAGIGFNVNSIKTTDKIFLSGSSTLANMNVQGNINQESVLNLNGMVVDGTIRYYLNTPSLPKSITYTNCNVNTVINDGDKLITITRINSTITNATDPEIESVTPITITIQADSDTYVAIYKPNGDRYYDGKGSTTLLLGGDAVTGSWKYKAAKYAHILNEGSFPIDKNTASNTTINLIGTLIVDSSISESNVTTVSGYTDLNTNRKMYDYLSYFKTTDAGIDFGNISTRSIGAIFFNKGLTLNNTATSIASVVSNVLILKSSGLNEDITVYPTGDFNLLNGSIIGDDVKIRANNFDSELVLIGITSLTLYSSTNNRDTDTNRGPFITDNVYRFKYGSSASGGVVLQGTQYARVIITGSTLLNTFELQTGNNILDLGTFGQIQQVISNQSIMNEGIKKASRLIPHSTNL